MEKYYHILPYLLQFIIGGTLITILYHFSKQKNNIICSIIPAFPTLFIIGLFYIYYFTGSVNKYSYNATFTFAITTIAIASLFLTLYYTNNTFISISVFTIIYILLITSLLSKLKK